MINKQVTLTISNDNREATLSNPITVYRGDGNINIQVTLAQEVYQYGRPVTRMVALSDQVTNVSVDVVKPLGNTYFTLQTVELVDNQFSIKLSKDFLDEADEVGTYYFQINTFDNEGNQATLPSFPLEVLPRLTDSVPIVSINDLIESGVIGSEPTYVTHVAGQAIDIPAWVKGETITVERMNEQLSIIKENDERINTAMTRAESVLGNAESALQVTQQVQKECRDAIKDVVSTTLRYRIVE